MSGHQSPTSRVTTLVEAAEKLSREVRRGMDADASEGTPPWECPGELEVISRVLLELCGPVDEAIDAVMEDVLDGPLAEELDAPKPPSLPPGQAHRLATLLTALGDVPISDAEHASLTWLAGFEADTVENVAGMIWRARGRSSVLAARRVPEEMARLRHLLAEAEDEVISRHLEADRYRRQLVDLCEWAGIDPGPDPHAALLAHLRGRAER